LTYGLNTINILCEMRTEWDSIKIWDFHGLTRPKRKWR